MTCKALVVSETSEGRGFEPRSRHHHRIVEGLESTPSTMAQAPDVGSHVRLKLTTHDGDTTIEGVVLPPAVAEHVLSNSPMATTLAITSLQSKSYPLNNQCPLTPSNPMHHR